jgi:hypothetical protein
VVEKIDDLLGRLREKAITTKGQGGRSRTLPDRHPVPDFFIADLVDWALKDDWHSMEHPFFSLSKNPDCEIRRYDHNGIRITVTPSVLGLATIWDMDILIYAVSQLIPFIHANCPSAAERINQFYDRATYAPTAYDEHCAESLTACAANTVMILMLFELKR